MMTRSNLHTHSTWCDGTSTLAEMVEAALSCGFVSLGLSSHADCRYCADPGLTAATIPAYLAEIERLRAQYDGRMELFSGMENDGADPQPTAGFDYIIGANHFVEKDGRYLPVDFSEAALMEGVERSFDGKILKMAAAYYAQTAAFLHRGGFDILAHFDLIGKYNEGGRMFDETDPAYREAAFEALQAAADAGVIVEVNTGAISRGYRSQPYPARFLLARMHALQIPVIVSSDAHRAADLCTGFDEAEALLRSVGYREQMQLTRDGFVAVPL